MLLTPSGQDDYELLQVAMRETGKRHKFASVSQPTSGEAIHLEGHFRTSQPLVSGDPTDSAINCVGLVSQGGALVEYTGPRTDAPLLAMHGNTVGGKGGECRDILANVKLCGNNNCRGVRLERQFHFHSVRNLHVEQTRQVALDAFACWKSSITNVHLTRLTGCAMRLTACDNAEVSNIRVGGVWGIWHGNDGTDPHRPHSTPPASKELWLYEMQYGEAAAREHFAGNYCEDWPADMPRSEQAAIWLNTGDQRFGHWMIEQCGMGDRPLIFSHKQRGKNLSWDHLYCEENWNRTAKVVIQGHGSNGAGDTKNFGFDVVRIADAKVSQRCQSFVRTLGTEPHMSAVRVRDIDAVGLGQSIIQCTGPGHYYGFSVDHARTDNRIPREQWITCDSAAVLTEDTPIGTDHVTSVTN